ncbi:DNA helicase RecQ [Flammeovirgaceae bacterium SG7u.111]|nr:DNA helicase RecQ [Flammeovirgaceae bacterium SG7u.132]WPO37754.1 DNA helicase RecQ [Flammeovirgaceae bacterium SG7u.111]
MKFIPLPMVLEKVLQKHFGYSSFRPQQKEIIEHVLEGKDAVVLMPTGGGKSICYQVPALVKEGLTVVISPLIALMQDQVQSLRANGVEAAFLNSSLNAEQESEIRGKLEKGEIKLLYVSPEKLFSRNFLDYLGILKLSLFAIDEAHCVSSWGHHFRPEYKKLYILKETFPNIPVVALTATADKAVRSDIGTLLKLDQPKYFIASFDRPNLSLAVLPGRKKWEQIQGIVEKYRGKSGIVYCSSRKATESLAVKLQGIGLKADFYHAGLDNLTRHKTQEDFIQGDLDIICATVAFGMGIDKADVRYVIHNNMPGNLESYYQEIGRAGRDGLPSETVLFYSYRDVQTHIGFMEDITDDAYRKIQMAKLDRMQEFAESQVCRRKVLMTYFSEIPEEDCGNCDVCKNPPKYFDGTMLAQMALSAMVRTKEKVGITTLVDILKGTYSNAVQEHGYSQIKTFGAGRQTTNFAWLLFIQQFIQQGIVELDYKDHYNLKLTRLSKEILFEGKKVQLVTPETIKERQEQQKQVKIESTPTKAAINPSLFEKLRILRKELAEAQGVPAFMVFGDASLKDMCEKLPKSMQEFLNVSGVGEHKAKQYGEEFLNVLSKFGPTPKQKGDTHKITLSMYRDGKSVEEIAQERGIQPTTVYSHFAKLISDGEAVDIHELVSEEEIKKMEKAVGELGFQDALKPYFDFYNGELEYGKIRVALSFLKLENNES